MQGWWVIDWWQRNPLIVIAWIFWVVLSICAHELGHGWMAIRKGDRTPIESGHMTWNPLVHMGPMSLIMFAMFGLAWGAMPVNPSRMRGRHADALVAFAGPLVNILLAALCLGLLAIVYRLVDHGTIKGTQGRNAELLLMVGLWLNLALTALNLLPVPPLDGSRILANFVPSYRRLISGEQGAMIGLIGFALVFLVFGSKVMGAAMFAASWLSDLVDGRPST